MTENLTLWRSVERTDPAQTKPITGKSYKGNSPKPHFLVFKATETFGPCGLGWGFEIVDEKLLDGALIEPGFFERIHMARVRVWYEWNGKRGAVEHVGQTVFCGRRKGDNGKPGLPFTDEDAPKKSVTDALIKALSMIGFAGDIFMGRYDDSKYVDNLKREIAEEARKVEQPAQQPEPAAPPSSEAIADAIIDLLARRAGPESVDRAMNHPDIKADLGKLTQSDFDRVLRIAEDRRAAPVARVAS